MIRAAPLRSRCAPYVRITAAPLLRAARIRSAASPTAPASLDGGVESGSSRTSSTRRRLRRSPSGRTRSCVWSKDTAALCKKRDAVESICGEKRSSLRFWRTVPRREESSLNKTDEVRSSIMRLLLSLTLLCFTLPDVGHAQEPALKTLRAGMIGLDTSHVVAFPKIFHNPKATGDIPGIKIVAGYPGGTDIPAS